MSNLDLLAGVFSTRSDLSVLPKLSNPRTLRAEFGWAWS